MTEQEIREQLNKLVASVYRLLPWTAPPEAAQQEFRDVYEQTVATWHQSQTDRAQEG